MSYLKVFGSKCYILKESRKRKFDAKSDKGIFLGYSSKSKAYRCLNLSTHKVIESVHVKVDEFVEKIKKERKKSLKIIEDSFLLTHYQIHLSTKGQYLPSPA